MPAEHEEGLQFSAIPLKSRIRSSTGFRYAFAVLLALLAACAQFSLQRLVGLNNNIGTYQLFLGATALSALWTGRNGGFVTLSTSVVLDLYFFIPPYYSVLIDSYITTVQLVLFLAVGMLVCLVGGALHASQEAFSLTLNSIGDAVVATDRKKSVQFLNPVAEALSGWNAAAAVGRNIREVLQIEDETTGVPIEMPIDAALRERSARHLMGGEVLVSRNGRKIPIEDSISPILSASNHARGAILVFRDVTEQRQAEKNLRNSENRYRFLADAVPEFIFTSGAHGEQDYCNQRWYEYTGLNPNESIEQGWLSVVHPEDASPTLAAWDQAVQAGTPFEREYRIRGRDGRYRWFLARGLPMCGPDGQVERWFGICTDIDDLRRSEEQLQQMRKMEAVGRLAGGVAHDFNNLLTVILGYGKILADAAEREGTPSTEAANILYAAGRAAELTRQLLTFSRQQVIRPGLADLNQVVSEMEGMLLRLIGEDIVVRTVLDPELPKVRIDRGQMEQVIVNLAVNARDAMPGGGRLLMETAAVDLDEPYLRGHLTVEPGRYVMLAVSDTGQGMDKDTQSHIFEPFFTTKAPGKGTGLGLSTVYGIVRQMGGHIWVYSEPGHGAIFKIYLPAVQSEGGGREVTEGQRVNARRGTETVLLLEDDSQVRQLVQAMLSKYGYVVLGGNSAADAIRLCETHQGEIQLLITDVVMPGLSGKQVAELARRRRPNLKVLFVSGYTGDAIAHHGVLDSGVEFLQKPFSSDALLKKVRDILDAGNTGSAAGG